MTSATATTLGNVGYRSIELTAGHVMAEARPWAAAKGVLSSILAVCIPDRCNRVHSSCSELLPTISV